jgi:hypothetical protein
LRRSEASSSGDITSAMELEQIMYWDLNTQKIRFVLQEITANVNRYNYVSHYKVVSTETGTKIVIDPITEEAHKIIQPVKRHVPYLKKLDNPTAHGINIYAFLNSKLSSGDKVSFGDRYEDVKRKFDSLPEWQRLRGESADRIVGRDEKLEFNKYKYVEDKLKDESSYNTYKKLLNSWRREYSNWTKFSDRIGTLESFEYKFEYKSNGKDKLSTKMDRLLRRLQPYEPKIILEEDTEIVTVGKNKKETINITKSVNFGVYSPYLVSDILRESSRNIEKGEFMIFQAVEILPISEYNIDEFAGFIHGFKSTCFEILSLYHQLKELKPANCDAASMLFIKFNHSPVYKASSWNTLDYATVSNIVSFKPCESISKSLSVTATKGVPSGPSVPSDLKLLRLEEPEFGRLFNDRVDDFDVMLANMKSTTASIGSLGSNFKLFYEQRGDYLNEILPLVENEDELLETDEEMFGPKVDVAPKDLGLWGSLTRLANLFAPESEEEKTARLERERVEKERAVRERMEQLRVEEAERAKKKEAKARERAEVEERLGDQDASTVLVKSSQAVRASELSAPSSGVPSASVTKSREDMNVEEIRKDKARSHRLAQEAVTVRVAEDAERARIQKIEDDAVTYRFDIIMGSLEGKRRRFDRLGLSPADVESLIRKAALGGLFGSKVWRDGQDANEEVVELILTGQVDAKIEEVAKSGKSKGSRSSESERPVESVARAAEPAETESERKEKKKEKGRAKEKSRRARDTSDYQKYLKYKAKYLALKKKFEEQQ